MQPLGLNSDINVGNKRLHIQTSFSESTSTIVANVFDDGQVVDARTIQLPAKSANGGVESRLRELHQSMVSDVELLFYISEKVRNVQHPPSCNKLGLVFLKRGFVQEAISFFRLAIAGKKSFAEAHNNLGLAYLRAGELARAEAAFVEGLQHAADYADLNFNYGRLFFEKKEYTRALDVFERALALNEAYYDAHVFAGLAYLQTLHLANLDTKLPSPSARLQRASKHFDRAGELFSPFVNEACKQARAALAEKKYDRAVEHFLSAYETSQQDGLMDGEDEFYIKFMYGGKGKDNAYIQNYIDHLKSTIAEAPEYADLHNNLGVAYLILCRNLFLEALKEFKEALRINPDFQRARKNLKLAENDGKGFLILLRALLK